MHTGIPPSFRLLFQHFLLISRRFSTRFLRKTPCIFRSFAKRFSLSDRVGRSFLQLIFYNILYYISATSGRTAPRTRSPPQPLLCAPSHPKAALPVARSIAPSCLCGNDIILRAAAFRHTEKSLFPAARKNATARRRPPMPCNPICSGAPTRWPARTASAPE